MHAKAFSFSQSHREIARFLMDRDTMDAMDIMDTNGHVLWTEWTRAAGDVLEPVHSSIKWKVHRVHSVHGVHSCPCP
jgi:hypothetical protein